MFRNLLSSRWFQAGLAFFVLCVGGSLLYSWHVHRTTEANLAKRPQPVVSIKNTPETNTAPIDFQTEGVTNTPDANTDTPIPEATEALPNETETLDVADAFLPDDVGTEETPAEDVPVSPFGFGPYPEVPADYPFTPFWLRPPPKGNKSREQLMRKELLSRVMVKAWTEGDQNFLGATGNGSGDGKVYLTYPNVIYVEYGEPEENDDGVLIRPIKDALSASYTFAPGEMRNGVIPPGFTVIEYDDAGYDPYTYLDLPSGTD
ncbi:hypothetical protein C6503_17230 [Candidatus Poribacteria bacterium]|nr:MAG: hypothetical protein C6503_17230 [Candidatus Poribacteria bacterium]